MSDKLPLKVTLAGYNVDRDVIDILKRNSIEKQLEIPLDAVTPETISAAYARISRNPAEVGKIREGSRLEVEKARKSNENIVFGLGHSSVAEHAAFNFDVVGISRLAVEAVERHRLASFTEKSQRYIKLDGDIVVPIEIVDAGFKDEFLELIQFQNDGYFTLYPKLKDYFTQIYTDQGKKNPEKMAKGNASEDARYVVSLATQAQFGMTINARTLETMIRDGFAHPLNEINVFANDIASEIKGLAPSLVKYLDATDYEKDQFSRACYWPEQYGTCNNEVELVDYDSNGEDKILAGLLVNQKGLSWSTAIEQLKSMSCEDKKAILISSLKNNAQWDPAPREFELAECTFDIVLSSAAYGQIKRHRMATQILGPYDPGLGWTYPDSVLEVNGKELFDEIMNKSIALAEEIAKVSPAAAPYALTNAHRRRIIFKANMREMNHISRLREDMHAQWDIRNIAGEMIQQVKEKLPLIMTMACGKHAFSDKHKEVYGE